MVPDQSKMGWIPTQAKYLDTIDRCLAQRRDIVELIESLCSQSSWLRSDPSVAKLINSLNSGVKASEFVESRVLAQFLPLVLQFTPDRMSQPEFSDWLKTYVRNTVRHRWIARIFSFPILLGGLYLTILVVASFTIFPMFDALFNEFELQLPPSTNRLLWCSNQISQHPIRTAALFALIFAIGIWLLQSLQKWIELCDGDPVLGAITRSSKRHLIAMVRLTATLGELLHIGTPLSDAIRISGRASGSKFFATQSEIAGAAFDAPPIPGLGFRQLPSMLPATLVHALQAGPDHTPSVPLIRNLSSLYANRLERRIRFGEGFKQPLMTLAMALLVGSIVRDLMLPMISLITSLSGG